LKNPQQAARAADVEAALQEKERNLKSPQGARNLKEQLAQEAKTAADIEEGIKGPSTVEETQQMKAADIEAQQQKTAQRAADLKAALLEEEIGRKSPKSGKSLKQKLAEEEKFAQDVEEGIKGPSMVKETKEMQAADIKAKEQKTALKAADLKAALLEEEIGKKSPKAAKALKEKLAQEEKFAKDVEEGIKGPSTAAEKQRMQEADIAAKNQKTSKRASDVETALTEEERLRASPEEAKLLKSKLTEEERIAAEVEQGIKGPKSLAEIGSMRAAEAQTQKTAKRASDVESVLSEKEKQLKSPQALQNLKDWYAELERLSNQPAEESIPIVPKAETQPVKTKKSLGSYKKKTKDKFGPAP
jgi:hypothetical protein